MQYFSRRTLDGRFLFTFADWYFEKMAAQQPGPDYLDDTVSDKYLVNSIADLIDSSAPEAQIHEDDFAVGDAFIFDKFVVHRTSPLLEGPMKTRMALLCRFFEVGALFDGVGFSRFLKHVANMADSRTVPLEGSDPFLSALIASRPANLSPVETIGPIASTLADRLYRM